MAIRREEDLEVCLRTVLGRSALGTCAPIEAYYAWRNAPEEELAAGIEHA
jgi:hypothetical protein